jgi:hypothetical protein
MVAALDAQASLREVIALLGGHAGQLLARRVLTPTDVDRFLAAAARRGLRVEDLVSTDDNLFLEYHTPRGNARGSDSAFRNLALLRTFGTADVLAGTRLTAADLASLVRSPAPASGADRPDDSPLPR